MRLTNAVRDEFLDAVMKATPWKNPMTDELAVAEFEKRAFEALPSDVKAVCKKYPGCIATKDVRVPGMPDKYADASRHRNPHTGRLRSRGWNATIPNIIDQETIKIDDLIAAVEKRDEEEAKRVVLRQQLRGVAYHATTVEELAAVLPELKAWLPKPAPKQTKTTALVPVGLVASLKKAGLPVTTPRKGTAS